MRKVFGGLIVLTLVLSATGCLGSIFGSRWDDAEQAMMDADPTITEVRADSDTDGFALHWSMEVDTSSDTFTAEQLKTIILISRQHCTREDRINIYVHGSDGELIDLWPAYTELGFDIEDHTAWDRYVDNENLGEFDKYNFDFPMEIVNEVLGE